MASRMFSSLYGLDPNYGRPSFQHQLPQQPVPAAPPPAGSPTPGYQFNPITGRYEATVGTAQDLLQQRERQQGIDQQQRLLGNQQQALENARNESRYRTSVNDARTQQTFENIQGTRQLTDAERQQAYNQSAADREFTASQEQQRWRNAADTSATARQSAQQGWQNQFDTSAAARQAAQQSWQNQFNTSAADRQSNQQQFEQRMTQSQFAAEQARFAAQQAQTERLNRLLDSLGSSSGDTHDTISTYNPSPFVQAPEVQYTGTIDVNAPMQAAKAAQEAAFGQAKAQAGALGQSSLQSLRSQLASRGLVGSGTESRGIVDRLSAATNPLSEANTAALHENVGISQYEQQLAQHAADTQYQGRISQRGQNQSAQDAWRQAQLTGRQQDLTRRTALDQLHQQRLQSILDAVSRRTY